MGKIAFNKRVQARSFYLLFYFIVILGFFQGILYASNSYLKTDQKQLLSKGIKLAFLGEWVHYGNAVSSGGHVPGSLSTLLVGIPLFIYDSYISPLLFISVLHLVSLFLLIAVLKEKCTQSQILIFCILYWLSPWRVVNSHLWNPSYLFFAAALHLYSYMRLLRQERSFLWSFVHVLAIGFAFQLHASSLILALISILLFWRKKLKINVWGVVFSSAAIFASLIPFYLEAQKNEAIIIPLFSGHFELNSFANYLSYGLKRIWIILKALIYWPRYSSLWLPHDFYNFNSFDFSRIFDSETLSTAIKYTFVFIRYVLGAGSLILSFWGFGWTARRLWRRRLELKNPLDNYILMTIIAIAISSSLSPVMISNWYILLAYPIAQIAFCNFLFSKFENWAPFLWGQRAFTGVALCFVVYNIAITYVSEQNPPSERMSIQYSKYRDSLLDGSD